MVLNIILQRLPKITIVNVKYRLANANYNHYPMQLDDITTIVTHLKEQQEYYALSDDLGLISVSPGAHLALLYKYDFNINKSVIMVCSIVTPTILIGPFYLNTTELTIRALINL